LSTHFYFFTIWYLVIIKIFFLLFYVSSHQKNNIYWNNNKNQLIFIIHVLTTILKSGKSLNRGKGVVPHVQLSTNCGFGCFRNKTIYFLCTDSQFFSTLTRSRSPFPCIEISMLKQFSTKPKLLTVVCSPWNRNSATPHPPSPLLIFLFLIFLFLETLIFW
jgi:hypothetical protein